MAESKKFCWSVKRCMTNAITCRRTLELTTALILVCFRFFFCFISHSCISERRIYAGDSLKYGIQEGNLIQIRWEVVELIHLAQDKDACCTVLDVVMKHTKWVEFLD